MNLTEPEILTARLRLSRLLPSDAEELYAYRSQPDVGRYQSFEPSALADAEAFIGMLLPHAFDTAGRWFQFGIRLQEQGTLIGDMGAHLMADDPRQVEIGFTVAPVFQGQGLATEAVHGLLSYLFAKHQKHSVFASVDPRNSASIALLKRIGMRKEAHFWQSLWFKGEWADDMVFAMLKSEWDSRQHECGD